MEKNNKNIEKKLDPIYLLQFLKVKNGKRISEQ